MKTKTEYLEVSGLIASVAMRQGKPFMPRYYSTAEHDEFWLEIELTTEAGETVYLRSPAASRSVASVPGAAVVTFNTKKAAGWLRVVGEIAVATPGKPADRHIEPILHVGDSLTVSGRVKTRGTKKNGKPYVSLSHITRK